MSKKNNSSSERPVWRDADAPVRPPRLYSFSNPDFSLSEDERDEKRRAIEQFTSSCDRLSDMLARKRSFDEILSELTNQIDSCTGGLSCLLSVRDGAFVMEAGSPLIAGVWRELSKLPLSVAASPFAAALLEGRAVFLDDLRRTKHWPLFAEITSAIRLHSGVVVPLPGGTNFTGVLAVFFPSPRHPSPVEFVQIKAAAHVVRFAVNRAAP